jgi:hypothetical protein
MKWRATDGRAVGVVGGSCRAATASVGGEL